MPESSIVIIANPASANVSARKIEDARRLMESRGLAVRVLLTRGPGDATDLARESAKQGAERIVAAGGDGTINEVLNGMAGTGVPLAVLPLGTANVLAREIGLPLDARDAARFALDRTPRPIPLGRISSRNGARYFALWAGIGFDGSAVHNVRPAVKRSLGKLAFILSGLEVLAHWEPQELGLTLDGRPHRCHSAIICGIRKYAGDFILSPDSEIADPHFHAVLVHEKGRWDVVRLAAGVLMKRRPEREGVSYLRGEGVEVTGAAHIQVDGEYFGESPAVISLHPDALLLVM